MASNSRARREGQVGSFAHLQEYTALQFIQERSLRPPEIKGPVWVSHAEFPASEPQRNDIRCLVDSAIRLLGRGDELYTISTLLDVKVE